MCIYVYVLRVAWDFECIFLMIIQRYVCTLCAHMLHIIYAICVYTVYYSYILHFPHVSVFHQLCIRCLTVWKAQHINNMLVNSCVWVECAFRLLRREYVKEKKNYSVDIEPINTIIHKTTSDERESAEFLYFYCILLLIRIVYRFEIGFVVLILNIVGLAIVKRSFISYFKSINLRCWGCCDLFWLVGKKGGVVVYKMRTKLLLT